MTEEKLKRLETKRKANYCNNCEGIGISDCEDYGCHTYAYEYYRRR